MPFYTGKSADGSDMEEVKGAYANPNNQNEWSSQPYPGTQRQHENLRSEYDAYVNGKYTLNDVYKQILNKVCPLNKRVRDFVLSHYDEQGNFKQTK